MLDKRKVKMLIEMMNSMSNSSIPAQKPIIEMFNLAMDEKMLDYLLAMKTNQYTMDELKQLYFKLYGNDEVEWKNHLDELLLMSFIHPVSNEERNLYELSPIFPGWVEFYTSGPTNEKRKAILEKFMEFWGILKKMNVFPMRQMNDFKSEKKLKDGKSPRFAIQLNTKEVVLNQELSSRQEVYTKGNVLEILSKNKDEIAVGNCFCRSHKKYSEGSLCELDIPTQSCIVLGALADQLIHNGVARKLSYKEAVELVEEFESKGCIHTSYHYKNDVNYEEIVICNCCKDCCLMYKTHLEGGLSKLYTRAFYKPEILDLSKCVGCNLCGKYCPTLATYYDLNKKELFYDYSNCIGCGQCVNQCKFDVRTMVKDERDVFVKTRKKVIY